MNKTALITGATSGHRRSRRPRVHGRRVARHRDWPPGRTTQGAGRRPGRRQGPSRGVRRLRRDRARRGVSSASQRISRHRPPDQQCWACARPQSCPSGRSRPMENDDRHQCDGARFAHPQIAAGADRPARRDHQRLVGRRDLSLCRRQRLWRLQSVREGILARAAQRSAWHRRARHVDRARHGRDRVHAGAHVAATRRRRMRSIAA